MAEVELERLLPFRACGCLRSRADTSRLHTQNCRPRPLCTPPDAVSDRFFVLPRLAEPDVLGSPAHPTTLVITASADPLRAEGAAYAEASRLS